METCRAYTPQHGEAGQHGQPELRCIRSERDVRDPLRRHTELQCTAGEVRSNSNEVCEELGHSIAVSQQQRAMTSRLQLERQELQCDVRGKDEKELQRVCAHRELARKEKYRGC